jgi:hypothetical protein
MCRCRVAPGRGMRELDASSARGLAVIVPGQSVAIAVADD